MKLAWTSHNAGFRPRASGRVRSRVKRRLYREQCTRDTAYSRAMSVAVQQVQRERPGRAGMRRRPQKARSGYAVLCSSAFGPERLHLPVLIAGHRWTD